MTTTVKKRRLRRSKTSDKRWSFQELIEPLVYEEGEEDMCHKTIGLRIGVSESMVKAARLEGMDEFMLDAIAVGLGMHPANLVDDWITDESLFAGEIFEKKMKLEDVDRVLDHADMIDILSNRVDIGKILG